MLTVASEDQDVVSFRERLVMKQQQSLCQHLAVITSAVPLSDRPRAVRHGTTAIIAARSNITYSRGMFEMLIPVVR
jgi:hypothetical protein